MATSVIEAGMITHQIFIRGTDAWDKAGAAWTDIPGAATVVKVPPETRRLLSTRFTAESTCTGSTGWGSVRVVVVDAKGTVEELFPASGTDFAFDSADDSSDPTNDRWESHAIERSTNGYLPAGTYTVKVQATLVSGANSFRLDDWHFAVAIVSPPA